MIRNAHVAWLSVTQRIATAMAVALAVGGCLGLDRADKTYGVQPIASEEAMQRIDLVSVLIAGNLSLVEEGEADYSAADNAMRLEKAFKTFRSAGTGIPSRNEVQDRIIAASNQACAVYLNDLKAESSRINLALGGLATLTAGLGSIFTAVDTVRALSGSAVILSGVRAQYNEEFFANLTIQVISDGIRTRRAELLRNIEKSRANSIRSNNPVEYTVQRAIGDAISYHMSCSLIARLEQAALSIERAENPGFEALTRVFENQTQMFEKQREMIEAQRLVGEPLADDSGNGEDGEGEVGNVTEEPLNPLEE